MPMPGAIHRRWAVPNSTAIAFYPKRHVGKARKGISPTLWSFKLPRTAQGIPKRPSKPEIFDTHPFGVMRRHGLCELCVWGGGGGARV